MITFRNRHKRKHGVWLRFNPMSRIGPDFRGEGFSFQSNACLALIGGTMRPVFPINRTGRLLFIFISLSSKPRTGDPPKIYLLLTWTEKSPQVNKPAIHKINTDRNLK
ncbi:MAG: hypothetical protein LBR98_07895 [Syntrophomonadaceae bacterium]|nr:hypothetical protein [Syntrophomonadaceae bacterium]